MKYILFNVLAVIVVSTLYAGLAHAEEASAGKNFTKWQSSAIAASTSEGVQIPGAKGKPAS